MGEQDSNYTETDQCVRGLKTFAEARSVQALVERDIKHHKQEEDHILRIDEQPDGTFDLIVLKRIN